MIGQMVAAYRIVRKLGAGGMGTVYEGLHQQLGRRAAIKVLENNPWTDEESLGRFYNEARATNMVQHPGVVSIFEFGRMESRNAFIIMEFIEGESLAERIKKQRALPLDFVLYLVRQIAATLTVVHQKGIYHRDLKPENIMLCPDREVPFGERTKLVDFGIAKLTETAGGKGAGAVRTRTGTLMGTPRYMSPEQCAGDKQIDAKTDVYSLGVMIFELVAQRPPFVAVSAAELVAKHLYEDPPSLQMACQSAPLVLHRLVASMLKKQASQRPTMEQVCTELEAIGAPTATRPTRGGLPATDGGENAVADPLMKTQVQGGLPNAVPVASSSPAGAQSPAIPPLLPFPESKTTVSAQSAAGDPGVPRSFAIGMLVLGLVGGSLATGMLRSYAAPDRTPLASASSPVPTVSRPVWIVQTSPAGASVIRKSDGTVLGQTPFRTEVPSGQAGPTALVLRLAGHKEEEIVLSHDTSSVVDRLLSAVPGAATDSPPAIPTSGLKASSLPAERPSARKTGDTDESAQDTPAKKATHHSRTRRNTK